MMCLSRVSSLGVSHAHYHRLLYKAKQRFIQVARESGFLGDFEEWIKP